MRIEKVANGYTVTDRYGLTHVFHNIEEVFRHLLLHFEGRCENFGGQSYGKVIVEKDRK